MKKTLIMGIFYSCVLLLLCQFSISGSTVTAGQLIEKIIKKTGVETLTRTTDRIIEGNPDTPVNGILTCMFATVDVLKQAVTKNCNFIIVLGPVYYNNLNDTIQLSDVSVFHEKRKYINDHGLVIWRFNDYFRKMQPDGILSGMVTKFGWSTYLINNNSTQFLLPEMTLKDLLESLKKVFPKHAFYYIGNLSMKLSKVSFLPGEASVAEQLLTLQKNQGDVLVTGEAREFETYEYMRDAVAQGRNQALILIGLSNSEESCMDYCAHWLKTFIEDIPIFFVETGSSFWSF